MKLNDVIGSARSALLDWEPLLLNPRVIRRWNREMTWENVQAGSTEPRSAEDFIRLSDEGQYSFQVDSNGFFQLSYAFSAGGKLETARLGFYELVTENSEEPAETADVTDPVVTPLPTLKQSTLEVRGIRADFAPLDASSCIHAENHLHILGYDETRLGISHTPTPAQFIELAFMLFRPEAYVEKRVTKGQFFPERKFLTKLALVKGPTSRTAAAVPYLRLH